MRVILLLFSYLYIYSVQTHAEMPSGMSPADFFDAHKGFQKPKSENCLMITASCRVCPDGRMVDSNLKLMKKQDPLVCLQKERSVLLKIRQSELFYSRLKKRNCHVLSSLCALCPDRSFVSLESDQELTTDLFECVAGPRSRQYGELVFSSSMEEE